MCPTWSQVFLTLQTMFGSTEGFFEEEEDPLCLNRTLFPESRTEVQKLQSGATTKGHHTEEVETRSSNPCVTQGLVSSKEMGWGRLQRDQENPIFEDSRKDPKATLPLPTATPHPPQRALEESNLQPRTGFLRLELPPVSGDSLSLFLREQGETPFSSGACLSS